jgi:chromosome segregation ATPase
MITPGKDNPVDQASAMVSRAPAQHGGDCSSVASSPSPRIVVVCPSCRATLSVRRVYVGNPVRCKQCDHQFTVPAALDSQAQQAAASACSASASHSQTEEIEQLKSELLGVRHERGQLQAERSELLATRDALSANHISALAGARAELVQLTKQIEQLTSELRAARDEREQLGQQLAESRNDLSLARADERQLREANQELVAAQARRESEYDATLNDERAQRQQLAEEVLSLRAKAEMSAEAGEQSTSAVSDLAHAPDASASELEAARIQTEELKWKLEDAEYRYRLMAETLGTLGVSIDLKAWPHGNYQTIHR